MGYNDSQQAYHAYHGTVPLSILGFREASAGDIGDTAALGGLLTSNTTPAVSGTGSTVSQQLLWAASNVDQVLIDVSLPEDFDGREDALVELWVASGGTTNAATFTVASSWDGGANVTDTATDATASTSVHKITAVIAAADIPDNASFVSIALTPAAHSTDTIALKAARLLYTPRVV